VRGDSHFNLRDNLIDNRMDVVAHFIIRKTDDLVTKLFQKFCAVASYSACFVSKCELPSSIPNLASAQ
jgi:hypothetical protein